MDVSAQLEIPVVDAVLELVLIQQREQISFYPTEVFATESHEHVVVELFIVPWTWKEPRPNRSINTPLNAVVLDNRVKMYQDSEEGKWGGRIIGIN